MAQAPISLPQPQGMGETSRTDTWWLQPLVVFVGLSAFVIYSTWAAWQGANYEWGPYLSPMYSPLLFEAGTAWGQAHPSHHSWFGAWPGWLWLPAWVPASPAFIILIFPAGFRLTCYYYRGAYYKAFWADPLNCGVGEPRNKYLGEAWFPLIIQNIHRYFFYAAAAYIFILFYDALVATFCWDNPATPEYDRHFGVGVGTLVMFLNVYLLGGYTFGCHSLRHLIGGKKDHMSEAFLGGKAYRCVSCLNRKHMLWAWCSLIWVGFTDFYIRMVAAGHWTDLKLIGEAFSYG